jgi:nucleotide-binding universal stress UspA family protein
MRLPVSGHPVAVLTHILLPTDGSPLALKGAKAGVKLAAALGARVTALYVVQPHVPAVYGEAAMFLAPAGEYEKASERAARKALAAVQAEARAARVPCTTRITTDVQPWGGILRVAHSKKCDAIAMASHGYGALGGMILGSQTQRVLARSKIPVLVTR